MKKILLPILMLLTVGLTLISCDLFGGVGDDSSTVIPTLESIKILSLPKRLNYKENSNFDVSGLEVVGVYSDNTVKMINDYTLSFENGTNVGTVDSGNDKKTIKNIVSYGGKETSFDINVRKLYKIKYKWFYSLSNKNDITKIVFDYIDNLPSNIIKEIPTQQHIGNTDSDLIYIIEDGTEIYIFSDGLICEVNDQWIVENEDNSLKEISFNNYDTSNFNTMRDMFLDCKELTSIIFGDNFNTSNVKYMVNMFRNCSQLTSLDLSSFDTSNVEHMEFMFWNCEKLTSLDLSGFNTSKVTDMYGMFSWCTNLQSLDISNFNTSNVNNMWGMFNQCSELTSITFGKGFNTSNVTNIGSMFNNCKKLTSLDLSKFDTSKVTEMGEMFWGCSQLTSLDLSNFDITSTTYRTSVPYTSDMFRNVGVSKPTTIYVSHPSDWSSFFGDCRIFTTKP